ncbi:MAG: hemerythrin [Gallionellaceae bacterium]|nr:MAG: hemerythrin [Gallionellaceae bacterium]
MSYQANAIPWKLEWSEELSVNIPEIDLEHQHFIALVNQLNEAISQRAELSDIKGCMQAIVNDASAHFAHEEALFAEWHYPAAAEHAQQHTQVLMALNDICARFEIATTYDWVEAGLKVKYTLVEHLLKEDMQYRDYLREKS